MPPSRSPSANRGEMSTSKTCRRWRWPHRTRRWMFYGRGWNIAILLKRPWITPVHEVMRCSFFGCGVKSWRRGGSPKFARPNLHLSIWRGRNGRKWRMPMESGWRRRIILIVRCCVWDRWFMLWWMGGGSMLLTGTASWRFCWGIHLEGIPRLVWVSFHLDEMICCWIDISYF